MPGSFFDSNILLYIASGDDKADTAEALLRKGGTISVQVLNEVANVARRKYGFHWDEVRALLAHLRTLLDVRDLTIATHEAGLALASRYQLSFYDALIAAAALEANCATLFTEDMQHGLVIDGRLRLVNPFAPA